MPARGRAERKEIEQLRMCQGGGRRGDKTTNKSLRPSKLPTQNPVNRRCNYTGNPLLWQLSREQVSEWKEKHPQLCQVLSSQVRATAASEAACQRAPAAPKHLHDHTALCSQDAVGHCPQQHIERSGPNPTPGTSLIWISDRTFRGFVYVSINYKKKKE